MYDIKRSLDELPCGFAFVKLSLDWLITIFESLQMHGYYSEQVEPTNSPCCHIQPHRRVTAGFIDKDRMNRLSSHSQKNLCSESDLRACDGAAAFIYSSEPQGQQALPCSDWEFDA